MIFYVLRSLEKINKSYKFSFIWYNQLSSKEKSIFDKRHEIIELAGINRNIFKDILITEKIQFNGGQRAILWIWDSKEKNIIIKKDILKDLEVFSSTLLHELAHANSRASDTSLEFERELTNLLWIITVKALEHK